MCIVKKGNKNTSLAYTSLVRLILEYGAACWDPYRECQINALYRVQNKAAKFAHHSVGSGWESLAQGRKIARMCALYKAYIGERAWKAIGDMLQAPSYLSRVDHYWKIRARKQRTHIAKYSFFINVYMVLFLFNNVIYVFLLYDYVFSLYVYV